jgi:hypothetical protein
LPTLGRLTSAIHDFEAVPIPETGFERPDLSNRSAFRGLWSSTGL